MRSIASWPTGLLHARDLRSYPCNPRVWRCPAPATVTRSHRNDPFGSASLRCPTRTDEPDLRTSLKSSIRLSGGFRGTVELSRQSPIASPASRQRWTATRDCPCARFNWGADQPAKWPLRSPKRASCRPQLKKSSSFQLPFPIPTFAKEVCQEPVCPVDVDPKGLGRGHSFNH